MPLGRFRTVRGRLLALLVAIAVPIGAVTALAALTTYRTTLETIEESRARAVNDFAVRTRVWYRGATRALFALATMASDSHLDANACAEAGRKAMERAGGFRAFLVNHPGGRLCSSALDADLDTEMLADVARELGGRPSVVTWNGADPWKVRYDQVALGGRRYLAILARASAPVEGGPSEALLLVEPDPLENVFDLGDDRLGMNVALLGRGGAVIATRGDAAETAWLPRDDRIPEKGRENWVAPSRAGSERVYSTRMVAEPDFYVVASFDDASEQKARLQFFVLLLAPLMTLTLLGAVYMRAIDRQCARWLRSIEAAARSLTSSERARVVIAEDMPSDIRSVVEAFNAMVNEQEVRQRRLQTALDDNRFLVRELHHRVKNSLQVVQSYIGLSKRDYRNEARLALADAECRVHVLSAAYRFTLADGEMQPVRVDLFIDDVVTMIANLIRGRDQAVYSRIDTAAVLSVDRIIPLGFLVADVASRALRNSPGVQLTVTVTDIDGETIEVGLDADRELTHVAPPRLFAGLLAQIQATQTVEPEGRILGRWRLRHTS